MVVWSYARRCFYGSCLQPGETLALYSPLIGINLLILNFFLKKERLLLLMQFTRAGHTQDRANAILITSTITVVLFSTVVKLLLLSDFC